MASGSISQGGGRRGWGGGGEEERGGTGEGLIYPMIHGALFHGESFTLLQANAELDAVTVFSVFVKKQRAETSVPVGGSGAGGRVGTGDVGGGRL